MIFISNFNYFVILSTNFSTIGATKVVAIIATGKLTDQAFKNLDTYNI